MADEKQHSETSSSDWQARVAYLRELAHIVAEEGLSELEIEAQGLKLTLKSAASLPPTVISAAAPGTTETGFAGLALAPASSAPAAASGTASESSAEKLTPIVSPMVGVFYRAPSPDDPVFVEVGDRVERGQTIGLIEAMKVFNEVTAEASGVVAQISTENGQLVETGQPLLLLK